MKKLPVLLLVLICFNTALRSQLNKGTWMIGGNLGFNTNDFQQNSIASTKTTNLQLAATAGYFVLPRFPIGVRTMLQSQHLKYRDAFGTTGEGNSNYLSFGPFARYYFLKKLDRPVN